MAMTPEHRKILQVNHVALLENMTSIDGVLDVLFENGIVTQNNIELIMSKKTTKDKARELVTHITRCGDVAFSGLLLAFVKTNQSFLSEMLDPNLGGMDCTDSGDFNTIENFTMEDYKVEPMTEAKKLHVSADNDSYQIKPADCYGRAVIINNHEFRSMDAREGTLADEKILENLFGKLHFKVVIHRDKKAKEMEEILKEESELKDHGDYQAFILCILSHGARDHVYGTDGTGTHNLIAIQDILKCFDGEHCSALKGKPKFIFLQACQNGQIQKSSSTTGWKLAKSLGCGDSIPLHPQADILLMLSTVAGDVSWRDTGKGSFFIRSLVHVLAKYSHKENVDNMTTKVVNLVSSMRIVTSTCGTVALQLPEKRSTLRKIFYFMP